MLKSCLLISAFAAVASASPTSAHEGAALFGRPSDAALFGRPSRAVFQPYHPYRDSAIFYPTRQGPIPVHVRIYSTPQRPPYYNVPPYIVLDP